VSAPDTNPAVPPASDEKPPLLPAPKPSLEEKRLAGKALRRLFLTLFLRGRTSRGLRRQTAPKSIGSKLALALVFYGIFGGFTAMALHSQSLFTLSFYLHSMTLAFLGMFVASSSGEVLFNKEEGDILLHRPVSPRALLWAKVGVLVQVSLWLAGAFNLVGFFAGAMTGDGSWLFPPIHAISTALEALFCAGVVVMGYQLCLRWFGREKLDGIMTTVQVLFAVAFVLGTQVAPQMMGRYHGRMELRAGAWWINFLPPAWFGGFDDALAGSGGGGSWVLAALAVAATSAVLWLAFAKLARYYEAGLQTLGDTPSVKPSQKTRRRRFGALVNAPPLRWWLRNPVSRASFLLTAAYLMRDRDVKLRIYPGVAPMLAMPVIFVLRDPTRSGGGFGTAFGAIYLGLIPLMALNLLQYSQQWQASDLFRAAPISGPAQLCHGARRAVLCFLTLPLLLLFALVAWWITGEDRSQLLLFLPGLIALPVYALVPSLGGRGVPLSLPIEEAKGAKRGLTMVAVMLVSMPMAGIALWAKRGGWLQWFLAGEVILAAGIYAALRAHLARVRWRSLEEG